MVTKLLLLMVETIAATGKDGMPSGYLYAGLMNVIDIHAYNSLISVLVGSKTISKSGDLLIACDEAIEAYKSKTAQKAAA